MGITVQQGYTVTGGSFTAASQAEQEAASDNTKGTTPANQHWHPSAAKFWALVAGAGTLTSSYNVASVDDDGPGQAGVNIGTDFSSANWCLALYAQNTDTSPDNTNDFFLFFVRAKTGALVDLEAAPNASYAATDPSAYHVIGYGDQ